MSIDDRYYFFLLYQKEMLKAYTYNVINPFNVDDLDTNSLNLKIELKDHQKVMLKKIIEIISSLSNKRKIYTLAAWKAYLGFRKRKFYLPF